MEEKVCNGDKRQTRDAQSVHERLRAAGQGWQWLRDHCLQVSVWDARMFVRDVLRICSQLMYLHELSFTPPHCLFIRLVQIQRAPPFNSQQDELPPSHRKEQWRRYYPG